jgi:hypothetical protein
MIVLGMKLERNGEVVGEDENGKRRDWYKLWLQ